MNIFRKKHSEVKRLIVDPQRKYLAKLFDSIPLDVLAEKIAYRFATKTIFTYDQSTQIVREALYEMLPILEEVKKIHQKDIDYWVKQIMDTERGRHL